MPPEREVFVPHEEILSYEEILSVCRIAASLGINRYKVTGGEPLCRKGALDFFRKLKALSGVEQVTGTTNGALLGPHVDALADIGVQSITISPDTLSQRNFEAITRSGARIGEILHAMSAARNKGLQVKINTVPLRGYNGAGLTDLARFALENGYHIRFIELMPVGGGREYAGLMRDEILELIEWEFGCLTPLGYSIGNGPAEYYRLAGYAATIGFISALSKKFCHACNRVRLTSLGYLKTCLHHDTGVDLNPLPRAI